MVPFETHQYKAGDVLASGIVLTEDGQLVHGVMVHDVMSSSPPTHFSLWAEYAGTGRLYQAPLTAEPIAISRWNIGFDQYDRNDVLVTFGLRLGQYEDVG